MKKIINVLASASLALSSCAQVTEKAREKELVVAPKLYALSDYLQDESELSFIVDSIFKSLDDTAKVAQLLMPAIGPYGENEKVIQRLCNERKIGGILLLNGTKEQFSSWVQLFDSTNLAKGSLPYLYSADAEPTLFNRKIKNTEIVKKAAELKSMEDVTTVTSTISRELNAIGINYNFSPVVDLSANKTVGYRGFGQNPANIVPWSNEFIQVTQNSNIIATAKHFPGHGLVSGDTHKALQIIDGELKEIKYYPPLIQDGVLSIMVGHLAVMNNEKYGTDGNPATISSKIITQLLKEEMQFKGLIVTDAMNMGGVTSFDKAELRSIEAGCDIALMPKNTDKAFNDIFQSYSAGTEFQSRADESIKKVIRMKVCLGLISYR